MRLGQIFGGTTALIGWAALEWLCGSTAEHVQPDPFH